jgi:hypothetical protein
MGEGTLQAQPSSSLATKSKDNKSYSNLFGEGVLLISNKSIFVVYYAYCMQQLSGGGVFFPFI